MKKKIIIAFLIFGLVFIIGYRLLHSANFLYPKNIPLKNFAWIFKSDLINKIETVYSFGNLQNEITYHDIDKKIRCFIWKFNEYQKIPNLDSQIINRPIDTSNFIENYYGNDPMLTIFNKQGNYNKSPSHIRFGIQTNLLSQISTPQKLDLIGKIKELAIFNQNDECEVKFEFSRSTYSRIMFCKKESDFFIIIYYGINGYDIDQKTDIFNRL